MKAEFQKFIVLFEELEEAGETAQLTLSTRGGKSIIKLQLQSSPSAPSGRKTSTSTLPAAPGRRRRHRGAQARACRSQQEAAHQAPPEAEAPAEGAPPSTPSTPSTFYLLPSTPSTPEGALSPPAEPALVAGGEPVGSLPPPPQKRRSLPSNLLAAIRYSKCEERGRGGKGGGGGGGGQAQPLEAPLRRRLSHIFIHLHISCEHGTRLRIHRCSRMPIKREINHDALVVSKRQIAGKA